MTFKLTRAPVPPASPRTINFEPTNFYATYSAAVKPVLNIFPGDIVHTWTADAGGVDAKGVQHRGGDSNTGPFYIEGAIPGDTIAVHLLKVRTNRSTARQGTRINAHTVTAAYLAGAGMVAAVENQAMMQRMLAAELREEAAILAHANAIRKRQADMANQFGQNTANLFK